MEYEYVDTREEMETNEKLYIVVTTNAEGQKVRRGIFSDPAAAARVADWMQGEVQS
jgi:hypothetical protein